MITQASTEEKGEDREERTFPEVAGGGADPRFLFWAMLEGSLRKE